MLIPLCDLLTLDLWMFSPLFWHIYITMCVCVCEMQRHLASLCWHLTCKVIVPHPASSVFCSSNCKTRLPLRHFYSHSWHTSTLCTLILFILQIYFHHHHSLPRLTGTQSSSFPVCKRNIFFSLINFFPVMSQITSLFCLCVQWKSSVAFTLWMFRCCRRCVHRKIIKSKREKKDWKRIFTDVHGTLNRWIGRKAGFMGCPQPETCNLVIVIMFPVKSAFFSFLSHRKSICSCRILVN